MRTGVTGSIIALAAVVGAGVLAVAVIPTAGQAPAAQASGGARPPRTVAGKPNFTGIWQTMTEANWDIQAHEARPGPKEYGAMFSEPGGVGIVEGNEIPYRPEMLAKKQENFAKRWTEDPEAKCYMPGVPRAVYMPFPFQIIQGTDKIIMAHPFASASRLIHMDIKEENPIDNWMGWSRGRWEGETLVVDVTNFNDKTWFDRAGNFHSEQLRVTERWNLASPDVISYEATIEDPKTFTRPWKISLPIYRRLDKNAQVLEFKCVPFAEELVYGHLRKKTE
jgi:hypothetical protein